MPSFISILPHVLAASTFAHAAAVPGYFRRQEQSHADLTIGKTKIPLSRIDGTQLRTYTTHTFAAQFKSFGDIIDCQWTVKATGNYDNEDERDYMINAMTTALTNTADVEKITISIEGNSLCTHQGQPSCTNEDIEITSGVNFQQIELNLENSANKAEMTYELGIMCQDASDFNCPNIVKDELVTAMGSLPAVEVAFAEVFMIFCAEDSG